MRVRGRRFGVKGWSERSKHRPVQNSSGAHAFGEGSSPFCSLRSLPLSLALTGVSPSAHGCQLKSWGEPCRHRAGIPRPCRIFPAWARPTISRCLTPAREGACLPGCCRSTARGSGPVIPSSLAWTEHRGQGPHWSGQGCWAWRDSLPSTEGFGVGQN